MKTLLTTTTQSKQTATSDTPQGLSVNLDLDPTEKKGPFLFGPQSTTEIYN